MKAESAAPWRFIDSGRCGAAFNMALDEALLRSVAAGQSTPVLRVYRWRVPSVSLGYGQKAERELDLARCREAGVEVVRRITGGRAVWHETELTYSFAGPADSPSLGRTVAESWLVLARAILAALELIGASAALVPAGGKSRPAPAGAANPCFSSASRYEIAVRGCKLVGSAQRRIEGAFLQQGSFLLHNCQPRLLDFLPTDFPPQRRAALEAVLTGGVAGLDQAAGRSVSYEEAASAFREGFSRAFGVEFAPGEPTAEELRLAEKLARTRYGRPERPLSDNSIPGQTLATGPSAT